MHEPQPSQRGEHQVVGNRVDEHRVDEHRVDLSAIPAHHRYVPSRLQVWAPRVLAVLALTQIGLGAVVASRAMVILWSVALVVYLTQGVALVRIGTTISAEGVRVCHGLGRGRLLAWSQVEAVCVQGRWDQTSSVRRAGGRKVQLFGVSPEVAERLAAQLNSRPCSQLGSSVASDASGGPGAGRGSAVGRRPLQARAQPGASGEAGGAPAGSGAGPLGQDLEGPFRRGPRRT